MGKEDFGYDPEIDSSLDEDEIDEILTTNFNSSFEETPSEDDEDIETEIEYEDNSQEKEEKGKKKYKASDMLDGALLITMVDIILPELAVFVYNKYVRKGEMKKATSAKIKLKQGQINQLKPLADAVLAEIDLMANPLILFGFALLSIYAMNIVHLANDTK